MECFNHLINASSDLVSIGGDIIILEEAAYIDPGFAYETVFPLLIVGTTSLLAISTVTSEINFFTRLLRMRDKTTNLPLFTTLSVTLACAACREEGKGAECPHMLHLVPRWQSGDRHLKLKTVMQDRPDLIESELSGLAFDSLQQVFRSPDLDIMFSQRPPSLSMNEAIHVFIDPAAGGPGSDYAVLSVCRQKGLITVDYPPFRLPDTLSGEGVSGRGWKGWACETGCPHKAGRGAHLRTAVAYRLHTQPVIPAQLHALYEPGKHFVRFPFPVYISLSTRGRPP